MFEHIVLRRAENSHPISAGQIAEALLYYQRVHLFIDRGTLFNLIKQIGAPLTLTLLRRAEISAVYCEEMLATRTDTIGVTERHDYVAITLAGDKDAGELKDPRHRLQFELERQSLKKKDAKAFVKGFLDKVPIRRFSGDYFIEGGVPAAAKRDLLDVQFVAQAIRYAVMALPGGYPIADDFSVEIIDTSTGYFVFSNLDLERINRARAESTPSLEPVTMAHLLTNILDARADLSLASFYGGDFITSATISSIIQARHAELLRRTNLNLESRRQFSEVVLPDSPSLAQVIDSGERTFADFLRLLDRASRFKDWLTQINPDEGVIRSYMRDLSSESWIQKLPIKTVRYLFTLAIEAISPPTGIVVGLADNFILERLMAGWRPNHFIENRYGPFVQK